MNFICRKISSFFLFFILCASYICNSYASEAKPLDSYALKKLVSGNTMIGTTSRSHSLYLLYFLPNGHLYFEKYSHPKEIHIGRWWIKKNMIMSHLSIKNTC